jgi:hypothetical protein
VTSFISILKELRVWTGLIISVEIWAYGMEVAGTADPPLLYHERQESAICGVHAINTLCKCCSIDF